MDRFLVFIIGAIVGSFLNVCIYRIPRGQSIVTPPSHCPHCKQNIPWYDNIPILSYLVLVGRCGFCRKRISLRYPFVEILAAVFILSLYIVFGLQAKFYAYSVLLCALIVATFIDFDFGEIPDEITLGGLAIGIIASFCAPGIFDTTVRLSALKASIFGAIAAGVPILLMGVFGKIAFKKEAMGGGDVKLMAMIGSVVGWNMALVVFFIAPFFGAAIGLFLKWTEGRETIPYGPYLSLATVIAIFFGNNIIRTLFGGL